MLFDRIPTSVFPGFGPVAELPKAVLPPHPKGLLPNQGFVEVARVMRHPMSPAALAVAAATAKHIPAEDLGGAQTC